MNPKVEAMLEDDKLISALADALGKDGGHFSMISRKLAIDYQISLDDARGIVFVAEAELEARLDAGFDGYNPFARVSA